MSAHTKMLYKEKDVICSCGHSQRVYAKITVTEEILKDPDYQESLIGIAERTFEYLSSKPCPACATAPRSQPLD